MIGVVDGYDREKLAGCLAARGLVLPSDQIVGVAADGGRVDFAYDASIWVFPGWIKDARLP
jgi:hypothetical protein